MLQLDKESLADLFCPAVNQNEPQRLSI